MQLFTMFQTPIWVLGIFAWAMLVPAHATEPGEQLRRDAFVALKKAATFYRTQVASHGGYVYYTSPDLTQRWGEGPATIDQIWVQPPGTPAVGSAYLAAYRATGDPYYLDAARETAQALLYGQLESGGWTHVIDFNPEGDRVSLYRNGKGRGKNFSSLDDGTSQAAIRFLVQLDKALDFQDPAVHQSTKIALDALLAAQFPNGAFPQGWDAAVEPQPVLRASYPSYDWRTAGRVDNYWNYYTLNDGLAGTVAETLLTAWEVYQDESYQQALRRLGDFLLLAQLPDPQPAWAQQYSYEMHPIWARRFEPAAIASRESQDVIATLMQIYRVTEDPKYLAPIPSALEYLRQSRLSDSHLARYYELHTNRPLYMKRQGREYQLTYDDSDLPNHYGWKTESEVDALQQQFQQLQSGKEGGPPGFSRPKLEQRVRAIIDALDPEGAWISSYAGERLVGQPKFAPGTQYIDSAVFNSHVATLSQFLQTR